MYQEKYVRGTRYHRGRGYNAGCWTHCTSLLLTPPPHFVLTPTIFIKLSEIKKIARARVTGKIFWPIFQNQSYLDGFWGKQLRSFMRDEPEDSYLYKGKTLVLPPQNDKNLKSYHCSDVMHLAAAFSLVFGDDRKKAFKIYTTRGFPVCLACMNMKKGQFLMKKKHIMKNIGRAIWKNKLTVKAK